MASSAPGATRASRVPGYGPRLGAEACAKPAATGRRLRDRRAARHDRVALPTAACPVPPGPPPAVTVPPDRDGPRIPAPVMRPGPPGGSFRDAGAVAAAVPRAGGRLVAQRPPWAMERVAALRPQEYGAPQVAP